MCARPASRNVTVFAGPTLAAIERPRARALLRGIGVRPPVKRRDIERLAARARGPGVIVIVDGVFHDTLAVGHVEIREALERGFEVWGLSSMGAIRAREMAGLGVRGYGRVFRCFSGESDFQDDEVALLHEPSPPWRAVSEPLVHLRAAASHLADVGVLDAGAAAAAVADLKSRWYGERTIAFAKRLFARNVGAAPVDRELADFRRFRWKTLDLEDFLAERPFERA
jgi:hypothetical protein